MAHRACLVALCLPVLLNTAFASNVNTNLLSNPGFYSADGYFPQPDDGMGGITDSIYDFDFKYNIYNRWQLTRYDSSGKLLAPLSAFPRAEHSPNSGEYFAHTGTNNKAYLGQVINFTPIKATLDQTRLTQGGYTIHFGGSQRTVTHTFGSDSSLISLQQFSLSPTSYSHKANAGWNVSGNWATHQNYTTLAADTTQLLYVFQADHHNIWSPTNYAYLDNAFLKIIEAPIYAYGSINTSTPIPPAAANYSTSATTINYNSQQNSVLNITNNATYTTNTLTFAKDHYAQEQNLNVNNATLNTNAATTINSRNANINLTNATWNAQNISFDKDARVYITLNNATLNSAQYLTVDDEDDHYYWINNGIQSLTLNNNSKWNTSAQVTNANHASIALNNSTWTASAVVENRGDIKVENQSQFTAQSFSNESDLSIKNSTANFSVFANTGTSSFSHESNLTLGYTVNSGSITTNRATLTHNDKLVNLGGNFTVHNHGTWHGNGGAYVLGGSVLFHNSTITTAKPFTIDSGTLTLRSCTKWTAKDQINIGSASHQATFNLIDHSHLDLEDNLYIHYGSTFNATNTWIEAPLGKTGSIQSDETLTFTNTRLDGKLTIAAPLIQSNDSVLYGYTNAIMTINADIQGSGKFMCTHIDGNISLDSTPSSYEFTLIKMVDPTSVIQLDILSETEHDFIEFVGVSDINNATINIVFSDSFAPAPSTQFQIFASYDNLLAQSLATANINLPQYTTLNHNTGILTYVPEPSTTILILTSSLILISKRRR